MAQKKKIIWTKFYWQDWLSDAGLRRCSVSAKGIWMDMLCIAAQHDPIGLVAVNGEGLSVDDIARLAGVDPREAATLIGELERNDVFARDRKGIIYSRRMVRDAKKAATAKKNGKSGGNPTLGKDKRNPASDNPKDKPPDKPYELEAISYKQVAQQESSADDPDVVTARIEIVRIFENAGMVPPDTGRVVVWKAQGWNLKLCVAVVGERVRPGKRIGTLAFFDDAIREAHEKLNPTPAQKKDIDWNFWAASWAKERAQGEANWPMRLQPNPGEKGCRCPPEVLLRHGIDPSTGNLIAAKETAA